MASDQDPSVLEGGKRLKHVQGYDDSQGHTCFFIFLKTEATGKHFSKQLHMALLNRKAQAFMGVE